MFSVFDQMESCMKIGIQTSEMASFWPHIAFTWFQGTYFDTYQVWSKAGSKWLLWKATLNNS
jgi:hypothetical protein